MSDSTLSAVVSKDTMTEAEAVSDAGAFAALDPRSPILLESVVHETRLRTAATARVALGNLPLDHLSRHPPREERSTARERARVVLSNGQRMQDPRATP